MIFATWRLAFMSTCQEGHSQLCYPLLNCLALVVSSVSAGSSRAWSCLLHKQGVIRQMVRCSRVWSDEIVVEGGASAQCHDEETREGNRFGGITTLS